MMENKYKQAIVGGILSLFSLCIQEETVLARDLSSETLSTLGISVPYTTAVTRGQFAEILYTLSGSPTLTTAQSPFSDVLSTRSDAKSITSIYNLGLLNGCGDGTFAPDRGITLGEAVTSALRLLGYTSGDIGYQWPYDFMVKGENIGLLENLGTDGSSTLTQSQMESLIYNIVTGTDKNGDMFLYNMVESWVEDVVVLSNSASNGGLEDQLAVLIQGNTYYYKQGELLPSSLVAAGRGTLLLNEKGEAIGFLLSTENRVEVVPTSVDALGVMTGENQVYSIPSNATLVLGETITTFGNQFYALEHFNSVTLYYGSTGLVELVIGGNNVWMDGYVITGYYESALPNPYQPTTVTVVGCEFQVEPDISNQFAQFAYGDKLYLMLNQEGRVADVFPLGTGIQQDMVGILQGDGSVILVNEITLQGDSKNNCYAEVGQLVKVVPTGLGTMTIMPAKQSTQDTLNLENLTLGSYGISPQVKIYESVDDGAVVARELSSLTLTTVPAEQIRYYHLNNQGEVDILLLNNATGDNYIYGIVETCFIYENTSLGELKNYGFQLHTAQGTTSSIQTMALRDGDNTVCGVLLDEDQEYSSHILLNSTLDLGKMAFQGTENLVSDGQRIDISSEVSVYYAKYDRWISLETALIECENFVGYYDKTPENGGKIRLILVE